VAVVADTIGGDGILPPGSAYVFTRSGGVWTQGPKFTASAPAMVDFFGSSLALDGDTLVIGAPRDDRPHKMGAAHVYVRTATAWSPSIKLTVPSSGGFGANQVALSADTLMLGDPYDDDVAVDSGAVYVFVRSGSSWSSPIKLKAPAPKANELFGAAIGLIGDNAIIGTAAGLYQSSPYPDPGAAYPFVRVGTTWTSRRALQASDAVYGDGFGFCVGLSGGMAVLGSFNGLLSQGGPVGGAYVFVQDAQGWTEQKKLRGSRVLNNDRWGSPLAISGDT